MAIAKGQKITYNDLMSKVISKIESVCQNVGSFRGVPAEMQQGHVNYNATGGNGQNFKITVNDSIVSSTVSLSDVQSQLTSFLNTRGISTASVGNKVITTRDMLNFYQNVAIFVSAKIVQVRGMFSEKVLLFYDKSASLDTAANIGTNNPGTQITSSNLTTLLQKLETNLANITRTHMLKQSWSVTCSCSSSSSSSCSSSSSLFIAYMRL